MSAPGPGPGIGNGGFPQFVNLPSGPYSPSSFTTSSFLVGGGTGPIVASTVTYNSATGLIQIPASTSGTQGISFGTDGTNANLYRGAASNLTTDGSLTANGGIGLPFSRNIQSSNNDYMQFPSTGNYLVTLGAATAFTATATSFVISGTIKVGPNGTALANVRCGTSTAMASGSVVVTDPGTTAATVYFFTAHTLGTITLPVAYRTSARSVGSSFTIQSGSAVDTSTVDWLAIN